MEKINNKILSSKIIDVDDEYEFAKNKLAGSINIPYDKLLFHHHEYLDKNTKYYICCGKGQKSKRMVSILKVYGYNVEQISKEQ